MLRIIAIVIFLLSISGCAELRVIGRSAIKELQAEAINVEWLDYQKRNETTADNMAQRSLVAKAEPKPFTGPGRSKHATYQKGLWERN